MSHFISLLLPCILWKWYVRDPDVLLTPQSDHNKRLSMSSWYVNSSQFLRHPNPYCDIPDLIQPRATGEGELLISDVPGMGSRRRPGGCVHHFLQVSCTILFLYCCHVDFGSGMSGIQMSSPPHSMRTTNVSPGVPGM